MITTAIKLRKQLMPTWNCFLLLGHFEKNKSCKNKDNICCGSESVIPDSSPHVEEEILLYLDSEDSSAFNSDKETASAKSGYREAASKEADLNLSYKNRNIYNTKYLD